MVEFDKFLAIYPEIGQPEQYVRLQNQIKNAILYASGTHADTLKSQKENLIDINPEDISRVKKTDPKTNSPANRRYSEQIQIRD